jgi:hypothetical protein
MPSFGSSRGGLDSWNSDGTQNSQTCDSLSCDTTLHSSVGAKMAGEIRRPDYHKSAHARMGNSDGMNLAGGSRHESADVRTHVGKYSSEDALSSKYIYNKPIPEHPSVGCVVCAGRRKIGIQQLCGVCSDRLGS